MCSSCGAINLVPCRIDQTLPPEAQAVNRHCSTLSCKHPSAPATTTRNFAGPRVWAKHFAQDHLSRKLFLSTSIMPPKSNFKRAMPQTQPSMLASLRTTQLVGDSKAVLPAGTNCPVHGLTRLTMTCRAHQHHPRLSARRRHVQLCAHLETYARDGIRRHTMAAKTEEYGLLERSRGQAEV